MPAMHPSEWAPLWNDLFAKDDVDGILALYEDDAVFVGQPGQVTPVFPNGLRETIGQFQALKGTLKFDTKSTVQTGKLAVAYGPWTFDGTGPDGPVHLEGVVTVVLAQGGDGQWRAKIDDFWSEG